MTTPPEPDDRPGLPGALRVGGLLVLEAAIVVALHQLGRYPWMRVEWSNLGDWIEDSAPEDVLLGVLRTLALVLAWWLLATTLLYVVAGLSRVPYLVRSARWVTLPGVRRVVDGALAASITGGALLTGPPGSLGTPAPVVATDVADRPATAPVPAEAGLRMAIYRAAEPLADPPPGVRTYTVEAGDTLWEIAERELGDGHRWPEIFDANAQRTGGVMSEGPDVLRVGWTLVLPGTGDPARSPDTVGSGSGPTSSAGGVVVERGDDLWSLAAEQLRAQLGRSPSVEEVADYWRALVAANEGRLASGDPDLIYPGERLTVPPVGRSVGGTGDDPGVAAPAAPAGEVEEPSDTPREAPERPAPAPAPAGSVAEAGAGGDLPVAPEGPPAPPPTTSPSASTIGPPTRSSAPPATRERADEDVAAADSDDGVPVPLPALLGAGSTVVAVGVLRTLRRRRVRRGARLPLSTVPPPPPRSTRPVERELLAEADEAAVDALDVGLANLASGLRPRGGEPCPQPRLVQLTGERLEVLLDRAEPAVPPPWRPEASGLVWVLDEPGELPATPDAALPLPALVTVGVGESTMLIDLEAYGVVALVGDPAACWGLARSMLTELSARTEGTVDVEVVGVDLEAGVGELDGVRLVADWDGVDTGLIGGSARLLDAGRWPHTFAARASGRVFDGWAPAVWFTAHNDHPAYRAALEAIAARPGAGSAVVVVGEDPGCGLRVVLRADGTFHIPELRLTGQTQLLAEGAVDQVAELFADADDLAVAQTFPFPAQPDGAVPTSGSPALHTDVSEAVSGADPSGYSDPSFDVLVRVCGEIHVQGGKEPLPPRESAVVAYVALNGPVDIERVRDAVWGGIDISLKRVRNVVSVARRSVGDAIIIDGGRLLPGEGLITDVELIRRRRAYAGHQADAAARVETLRGALEWVTGPVCTYPRAARRNWTWIELDRWISHVESLVGSVACTLAELCLELGDSDGACGAARRGLDATGQREELTLLLVQGYELAGDEPAARAALRSYERHMDELGAAEHSEALLRAMERYGQPRPGRAAG